MEIPPHRQIYITGFQQFNLILQNLFSHFPLIFVSFSFFLFVGAICSLKINSSNCKWKRMWCFRFMLHKKKKRNKERKEKKQKWTPQINAYQEITKMLYKWQKGNMKSRELLVAERQNNKIKHCCSCMNAVDSRVSNNWILVVASMQKNCSL